jgi:hypothetical protein
MRLLLLALFTAMPAEAAFTLQGLEKPARLTMAATWGTITLPAGTEYIVVRPITDTAQWGVGCTDGAAVSTHYTTLTADVPVVFAVTSIRNRNLTVCLAGTASAIVEVTPMGKGL